MPKKSKGKSKSGLMSSAGLMRYFDAEESAIHISPKAVVISGIGIAVAIIALNTYF